LLAQRSGKSTLLRRNLGSLAPASAPSVRRPDVAGPERIGFRPAALRPEPQPADRPSEIRFRWAWSAIRDAARTRHERMTSRGAAAPWAAWSARDYWSLSAASASAPPARALIRRPSLFIVDEPPAA